MATNCPQHVNPRAWRSASVRFTRAWNSVRGNSLRSWLNMLENSRTGEPPSCGVSMLGRFDPTIRQVAHPSPNPNWDKSGHRPSVCRLTPVEVYGEAIDGETGTEHSFRLPVTFPFRMHDTTARLQRMQSGLFMPIQFQESQVV